MSYDVRQSLLVAKEQLAPGIFDYRLQDAWLAGQAKPGQFLHILVPGKTLRRPISICDVDPAAQTVRIVFEVRGEGTAVLAAAQPGDVVDVLGPLGHGFAPVNQQGRALFVGGGIGVPPLLYAARQYGGNATVILGFRNREAIILQQDFVNAGCRVLLTTDDGSAGAKGLVTAPLEQELQQSPAPVYACGPTPMLRGVAALAKRYQMPCQVSLEERMGCGVGACLVCACKVRRADGSEGYLHVCKDGPVFDAQEVIW